MNKNPDTAVFPGKSKYSIVYKLNFRLMLRLIGIFLYIDIIICCIAAVSALVYMENTAANAAAVLAASGLPKEGQPDWLGTAGLTIEKAAGELKGFFVPKPLRRLLPEATNDSKRAFELRDSGSKHLFRKLEGLRYIVYVEHMGSVYKITVNPELFIGIFSAAMITLIVIELFTVLSRASENMRLIRKTLDPITEFTRVAQSLNTASSRFDPEKMAAFTGRLEGINASRLDIRIPIDETQDELKNLARAINGMLDRIKESYLAQVRFVSDASHELRTPISVIQGYANLLDRWGKNDEKTLQEAITAIKDEAANMKELIEQLLFLARGDNDTIILQLALFNLSELAGEVINEMRMIDSTHCFETNLSEAMVSADKGLIKQALRILVDNAIKYTDPGGHILVKTECDGRFSRIWVQDDGIGIRPEVVPHIFDRFYRDDESRARATGGAGLGLSIARWISSKHGGHMEVLSREGLGTRIGIVLPAALPENEQIPGPPDMEQNAEKSI